MIEPEHKGWLGRIAGDLAPGFKLVHSAELGLGQPGDEGLLLLQIERPGVAALISLQGAQLLRCCLGGNADLFWLSPNARMQAGQAIRGGVPVCLPWFGVNQHAADPQAAVVKHGFARLQEWAVSDLNLDNDRCAIEFTLAPPYVHSQLYPCELICTLRIEFSDACSMELKVTAIRGQAPFSWALHSYFAVAALQQVEISGLSGRSYLDNTDQLKRRRQEGTVTFRGETDRVYLDVGERQTITDSNRSVVVSGTDAPTAVVWNPGAKLAARMADVGAEHADNFVCLERGAAFDDELMLTPDESLSARVWFRGEPSC
ncbi:MAG: D-hexose-6-phosphate mutarotase [Pseudomonadota bacterium]